MNRRMLLVVAGWLGAAVLAVVVGMTAINVIGAGLTSRQNRPLTAAEVDELLRQLPAPAPSASQAVGNAPTTKPAATSQTLRTRAGTVVARCAGGRPAIVSMSPVQGWSVHEQHGAEGEFRSTSDNHNRVKFDITCTGTEPTLSPHG